MGLALAQPKVVMFELGSRKLKNFTFVKPYIKALLELELSLHIMPHIFFLLECTCLINYNASYKSWPIGSA